MKSYLTQTGSNFVVNFELVKIYMLFVICNETHVVNPINYFQIIQGVLNLQLLFFSRKSCIFNIKNCHEGRKTDLIIRNLRRSVCSSVRNCQGKREFLSCYSRQTAGIFCEDSYTYEQQLQYIILSPSFCRSWYKSPIKILCKNFL